MRVRSAVLGRLLSTQHKSRPSFLAPQKRATQTASAMADVRTDLPEEPACSGTSATEDAKVETKSVNAKPKEEKLPKLSAHEFRTYNRMAEGMNYYHNSFRRSWTVLYSACEANKRPAGLSIRQFLNVGLQFCQHLTMHHDIEEAHIFPILAKKMPAFQHEMEMRTAHKSIHAGLEKLEPWLEECRSGERELDLRELKSLMDTFGKVLWQHLDEEVDQLGAENMRKYWTIAEMQRMPM